ncbi:MAG: NUDIX domain-containing protein, partial [Anaerolineae bacterium]
MGSGTVIDDSWYSRPAGVPQRTSAGGVIARVEAGTVLVGLVREGDFPDYILPKGRLEPGEEVEAAAVREIAEEAGITDLRLLRPLGVRERLSFDR